MYLIQCCISVVALPFDFSVTHTVSQKCCVIKIMGHSEESFFKLTVENILHPWKNWNALTFQDCGVCIVLFFCFFFFCLRADVLRNKTPLKHLSQLFSTCELRNSVYQASEEKRKQISGMPNRRRVSTRTSVCSRILGTNSTLAVANNAADIIFCKYTVIKETDKTA